MDGRRDLSGLDIPIFTKLIAKIFMHLNKYALYSYGSLGKLKDAFYVARRSTQIT